MQNNFIFTIFLPSFLLYGCNELHPAKISVVEEVSLGEVLSNTIVPVSISIENLGDKPLECFDISGSCSCTVPAIKKLVIKPRSTGKIDVSVRTGSGNHFRESVIFKTNDPERDLVKILISGMVDGFIDFFPDRVLLLYQPRITFPVERNFEIRSMDEKRRIESIRFEDPFDFIETEVIQSDDEVHKCKLIINEQCPTGELNFGITCIVSSDGEEFQRKIPVVGIVKADWLTTPAVLFFDGAASVQNHQVEIPDEMTGLVKVSAYGDRWLKESITWTIEPKGFEVHFSPAASGATYQSGNILLEFERTSYSLPIFFSQR